jgi:hypothetical protein
MPSETYSSIDILILVLQLLAYFSCVTSLFLCFGYLVIHMTLSLLYTLCSHYRLVIYVIVLYAAFVNFLKSLY